MQPSLQRLKLTAITKNLNDKIAFPTINLLQVRKQARGSKPQKAVAAFK